MRKIESDTGEEETVNEGERFERKKKVGRS